MRAIPQTSPATVLPRLRNKPRRLSQHCQTCGRHLPVLRAGGAAHADRADELAVHYNGQTAFHRHGPRQLHDDNPPSGHGFFERLSRPLEENRARRFLLRNGYARHLRAIHALEINQVAAIVHNGNDHGPVVLSRFCVSGGGDLFGRFQR
jgi:hypothetical protein